MNSSTVKIWEKTSPEGIVAACFYDASSKAFRITVTLNEIMHSGFFKATESVQGTQIGMKDHDQSITIAEALSEQILTELNH